jgi:hypothetical protein
MAETIPGGLTISATGYWQNAEGQYVDEQGRLVDEPIYVQGPSVRAADIEPGPVMAEKKPAEPKAAEKK